MRREIILIAAIAENNAIGKDNDLLWHLPDDFKRFKKLTSGHPIIMGRKTFESLPGLLPNRKHIVITRNPDYKHEGAVIVHSLEEALANTSGDPQIFIIGGGMIYDLAMPFATKMEITRVHAQPEAEVFFPDIDKKVWKVVAKEHHSVDNRHNFSFDYLTYQKN